jgi:hypothetical protein
MEPAWNNRVLVVKATGCGFHSNNFARWLLNPKAIYLDQIKINVER